MVPKLPQRQLGKNGPMITALGFGAMGLSAFYGKPEADEVRFKVLDRAYELGETNWDSADIYMDNEDLIGKWFKRTGKRDEIFLATKFANYVKPDGSRETRNEPEYVKEACAKSLKRLGVSMIDLYYCHRLSGKVPIEEMVGAMAELVKEGKVKYLGLSECSSESLRRAYKVHPIQAVQIEYSPFTIDIEDPKIGLMETCKELGVAIVAYSPLGRGFITGQYKSPDDFEDGDFRKMAPRFSAENFPKNLKLVDHIGELAKKKGITAGQLTLAWLLKQDELVIPIPGTKKIKYLEENLGALDVVLSEKENTEIRNAVESAEIHGDRYPTPMMKVLFGDTPPAA
ncbi:Aldo-keto reductase str7 [Xylographa vitiligo]|nr:Aldo-keto reductase str7 [Xylographa vitiligo]